MLKLLSLIFLFATTACSTIEKPFFWEIEKDGKKSYILGTLHYGVPYSNLPSYVTDKIKTSKVVYAEVDLEDIEEDEKAHLESEKKREEVLVRREENDPPLSKVLRPEVYDYVVKTLSKKYPLAIEKLSPRGIAILVSEETQEKKKIYVSRYEHQQMNTLWGMDLNVIKEAKSEGKYVGVLDKDWYWTSKEYRVCASAVAVDLIERMYRGEKIGANYEEYAKFLKLVEHYKNGDEKLNADFYASVNDRKDSKCLLEDRNKLWLPEILNSHYNNAPVFYTVGYAHMIVEPGSLKTLLKEKGFKIERYIQK